MTKIAQDPSTPMIRPRLEAFAQAIALGRTPVEAAIEAGYAPPRNHLRLRLKLTEKRVEHLRTLLGGGNTRELAPIIEQMIRLAGKAAELETASGLASARGLLAEAARLKQLLPESPTSATAATSTAPAAPALSREEWLAAFGRPT